MKRTKLIASLLTCVMCLSFLAVGVWAAVAVNFGFGANLQYTPEGVFVELSGQVYRGDSASTLEPLTSDPRFTLEKQTNFDNSSSEPSGNFPLSAWDIDNLAFTPVDRFIEIRVTIKNHSAFSITATPKAQLNSQDITSSTFTNFTVTDNRAESGIIKSGETKTYTLLIELNEGSTAFTGNALSVNFTFDNYLTSLLTWVEDDPDTTDVVDGYYTLTMGDYNGTPLVWRMVLKEEENNDVSSVANYTQDIALSGSYYFLLDTYIEDVFVCSFENNFTGSYPSFSRLDEYGTSVNVNDYAVSNIREYLTGTDVYRGYTSSDGSNYEPALATGQEKQENFLDVFNITSSPVYSMIEGRSLSDLYSRMNGGTMDSGKLGTAVTFDTDVENGVEGVTGIDPDTTEDKLWLLSNYEASKITMTQSTEDDSGARSWGYYYLLRSPNLSLTYYVYYALASGLIDSNSYASATFCARPAFKISF